MADTGNGTGAGGNSGQTEEPLQVAQQVEFEPNPHPHGTNDDHIPSGQTEEPLQVAQQVEFEPNPHPHGTNDAHISEDDDHIPEDDDEIPEDDDTRAEQPSDIDVSRLYRREGIISNVDLRVDVANQIACMILKDEEVDLNSNTTHMRGDLLARRGSRDREVTGRYTNRVKHQDLRLAGDTIIERAEGGVELRSLVEFEAIMGGAYVNTITGAYLRLCAWADFLAWGGWMEADVVRVELAAVMIRSNMYYTNACRARITRATVLVDDFQNRIESFGVFDDRKLTEMNVGSPGSGVTVET